LKRRIRQHLLLRGSFDFVSEEEYDRFLIGVLESANRLRTARLGEDLAAMRESVIEDLADYREMFVSVGNNSTIRVRKQSYSVPNRLIGTKLLARIYENRIVLLAGAQEVAQLPLGVGDRGAVIDFRHLIGHLLRKPGAFAGYRWREEMFPSPAYRAAYDHLTRTSLEADRRYLEILKVAADEGQTVVDSVRGVLLWPSMKTTGASASTNKRSVVSPALITIIPSRRFNSWRNGWPAAKGLGERLTRTRPSFMRRLLSLHASVRAM